MEKFESSKVPVKNPKTGMWEKGNMDRKDFNILFSKCEGIIKKHIVKEGEYDSFNFTPVTYRDEVGSEYSGAHRDHGTVDSDKATALSEYDVSLKNKEGKMYSEIIL